MIIHCTTALCGADYEWAVHAFYFGEKVGLDAQTLRWAQLEQIWSAAELIEMAAVAGHYRLVSVLVNALRIEHEPYARELLDALAPDQHGPREREGAV